MFGYAYASRVASVVTENAAIHAATIHSIKMSGHLQVAVALRDSCDYPGNDR
jgi:hypothetical protein